MLQISDNYNLLLYTDCLCAADAVLITEGLNIEMNWEGMTQANSDVDLAPSVAYRLQMNAKVRRRKWMGIFVFCFV